MTQETANMTSMMSRRETQEPTGKSLLQSLAPVAYSITLQELMLTKKLEHSRRLVSLLKLPWEYWPTNLWEIQLISNLPFHMRELKQRISKPLPTLTSPLREKPWVLSSLAIKITEIFCWRVHLTEFWLSATLTWDLQRMVDQLQMPFWDKKRHNFKIPLIDFQPKVWDVLLLLRFKMLDSWAPSPRRTRPNFWLIPPNMTNLNQMLLLLVLYALWIHSDQRCHNP